MNIPSKNFNRQSRLAAIGNGRECLRWLRIHEAKGEVEYAAKVRATLRGYIAEGHKLSQDQKRMDAVWSEIMQRAA